MPFPYLAEPFAITMLCTCVLVLATGCGLSVWLTGWRGKNAGIILGAGVVLSGFVILYMISQNLPRYWWVSLLPIYLGIQCIQIWTRREATRGFRLSSLLLTIGMLGPVLGGVGQLYRQRQTENPAVAKIESLEGTHVQYAIDGFASGVILDGTTKEGIKECLPLLAHLQYLRRLQLNHHILSLEQAKQIGRLTQLRELGLQATGFDDEKVAELSPLHRLETIDVMSTSVTAAGLNHLRAAKDLRVIWIDDNAISQDEKNELRAALPKLDVN